MDAYRAILTELTVPCVVVYSTYDTEAVRMRLEQMDQLRTWGTGRDLLRARVRDIVHKEVGPASAKKEEIGRILLELVRARAEHLRGGAVAPSETDKTDQPHETILPQAAALERRRRDGPRRFIVNGRLAEPAAASRKTATEQWIGFNLLYHLALAPCTPFSQHWLVRTFPDEGILRWPGDRDTGPGRYGEKLTRGCHRVVKGIDAVAPGMGEAILPKRTPYRLNGACRFVGDEEWVDLCAKAGECVCP